ncbi:hypothetical protein ACHAAC_05085 [Aeromicrobium sp. CF4.19]|uniref:hypothetical protein n=1 Tax=Aeromicrobium sp. CF4.19 TaxID=3373082 RepID=UPI003EE7F490
MKNQFLTGLGLAVAAAASVLLGDALGLDLVHVTILGVAIGAAVVLVPDSSRVGRIVGLLMGVGLTWFAYALRAGFLPDTDLARAIAFFGVFLVAAGIAAASAGRLPLWSILAGVAALAGAYEFTFDANPPLFTSESVVAVTSVLLTVMLGALVAALTTPVATPTDTTADAPAHPAADEPQHRETEDVR